MPAASRSPGPRLELCNVSKSFGETHALRNVSLDLMPGEVHVLAGENGAGKSTLIRILSGALTQYLGELWVNGQRMRFRGPRDAKNAGISSIHQELSLCPNLSTVDNLLLGTPGAALSRLRRARARSRARALLDAIELDVDLDVPIETLPLSDRQLIEIARALGQNASVLVMDEPTSALSEPEAERLFSTIERLRQAGTSILYISHRMEEIYRLADRISVLRDGEQRLTRQAQALPREELVQAMLGRDLAAGRAASSPKRTPNAPVLCARGLSSHTEPRLRDVSFQLAAGEILGFCGQRASGASEVLYALFDDSGGRATLAGDVRISDVPYQPGTPAAALRRGMILLPRDRSLSVFPELSVLRNASLSSARRFAPWQWIDRARERTAVLSKSRELSLKAPALEAAAGQLSGGNQQKLALLRCLLTEPQILLLDDPTRGIDVGAKAEVYALLETLSAKGVGVLLFSSELDELCSVAHRVLVWFEGRVVTTVERPLLTRERLLAPMMGGVP